MTVTVKKKHLVLEEIQTRKNWTCGIQSDESKHCDGIAV